jgi:hypothetical protein
MLQQFVIPELKQHRKFSSTIFQQDGATPHTSHAVRELLMKHFGSDRVISRFFPHPWPARSPDISPCDFYLWGYLKNCVYSHPISDVNHLKHTISHELALISTHTFHSVIDNLLNGLIILQGADGGHIEML